MNQTINKICAAHGECEHVAENFGGKHQRLRCKKCRVEAVSRKRRTLKIKAIEYLGGECSRCGYDKCPAALEFHHKNPEDKSFTISQNGMTYSWEKLKSEIDKCLLVCSNCHKEEHYEQDSKDFKYVYKEVRKCVGCSNEFETLTKGKKVYCSTECRKR